jgi:hypothetical protein
MVSLVEKPPTGKPDAGNPPIRFGGRGGANHATPTPIVKMRIAEKVQSSLYKDQRIG